MDCRLLFYFLAFYGGLFSGLALQNTASAWLFVTEHAFLKVLEDAYISEISWTYCMAYTKYHSFLRKHFCLHHH